MKFTLLCMVVIVVATQAAEVTKEEDCKCWENFKPEKGVSGSYYCTSEKTANFGCNEEKPPICKCVVNEKPILMDLGITTCLSVDLYNGRWCQNKDEFIEYFKKHPEHAIYD